MPCCLVIKRHCNTSRPFLVWENKISYWNLSFTRFLIRKRIFFICSAIAKCELVTARVWPRRRIRPSTGLDEVLQRCNRNRYQANFIHTPVAFNSLNTLQEQGASCWRDVDAKFFPTVLSQDFNMRIIPL